MEAAVIARLNASSITAYPLARPQGSALPCCVVARTSGGPLYTDDGHTGLTIGRVSIDCYDATYTAAKDFASSVKALTSGLIDYGVIKYMMVTGESDSREDGINAAEYLYRVSIDYNVIAGENY